jgi:hypothetical protein
VLIMELPKRLASGLRRRATELARRRRRRPAGRPPSHASPGPAQRKLTQWQARPRPESPLPDPPFVLECTFQGPCLALNGTRRATMPQVLTRHRTVLRPFRRKLFRYARNQAACPAATLRFDAHPNPADDGRSDSDTTSRQPAAGRTWMRLPEFKFVVFLVPSMLTWSCMRSV